MPAGVVRRCAKGASFILTFPIRFTLQVCPVTGGTIFCVNLLAEGNISLTEGRRRRERQFLRIVTRQIKAAALASGQ